MTETANDLIALSSDECHRLLTTHRPQLGRLGFVDGGWPMIFPMNYAVESKAIYFKTAPGSKLFAVVTGQQVSFQIDYIAERWEEGYSVLALGRLRTVTDPEETDQVDQLPCGPWARGDRHDYLRLDISSLSGRRIINPA